MLGPDNRESLGIRDPKAVDTGVLARTVLVGRLLGHTEPGLVALTEIDVARFARLEFDVVKRAIQTIVATTPRGELPRAAAVVAQAWADSLKPLETVLLTASQD